MGVQYLAVRGERAAGVLDIAAQGAALLHFQRAGDQPPGADHFRRIERDARGRSDSHNRHRRGKGFRGGYRGGFDAADGQGAGFGFVLNYRAIGECNMPRIG